jgi:hypothetical protein
MTQWDAVWITVAAFAAACAFFIVAAPHHPDDHNERK